MNVPPRPLLAVHVPVSRRDATGATNVTMMPLQSRPVAVNWGMGGLRAFRFTPADCRPADAAREHDGGAIEARYAPTSARGVAARLALTVTGRMLHLPLRTSTVQQRARRSGRRRHTHGGLTHHALERFVAASLEMLLNAIDANDSETGAHVRRVAMYALILADAADLTEHEQRVIEHVALFHDIGKIHGALFDIVHDNSSLLPADRRAIATHPQRGATVLAPLSGSYPELPEGVLSHHERWDGGGYPRGLKGRRIPLAARLVAIVDTFDAITHHRSYRHGRSSEVARNVILEGRGTQFDPELVDLFTFPPVFARVVAIQRQAVRWKPTAYSPPIARDQNELPDLTFRWRMGPQAARGWRAAASDRRYRRKR